MIVDTEKRKSKIKMYLLSIISGESITNGKEVAQLLENIGSSGICLHAWIHDNNMKPILDEAATIWNKARQLLKSHPEKALELYSQAAKLFDEASNYFRALEDNGSVIICQSMEHHCQAYAFLALFLTTYACPQIVGGQHALTEDF